MPVDHRQRRLPLGLSCRLCRIRLHHEAVPVLDQRMAHEVKLRRLALAFAEQLRVRIGLALLRGVSAGLAVKIARAIATRRRRFVGTIFGAELLSEAQASTSVPSTEK